jgi:hypothetical protein
MQPLCVTLGREKKRHGKIIPLSVLISILKFPSEKAHDTYQAHDTFQWDKQCVAMLGAMLLSSV